MDMDTRLHIATAEELLATAVRMIHAAMGEDLAIKVASQMVEDYARRASAERLVFEAHVATKH